MFVADLAALELDPADRHHLERVLRLRPGDRCTVSDGRGGWRPCRFVAGRLEPEGEIHQLAPLTPVISVAFALVKGARPELVIQKLTELGVDVIRPFSAARSVVRWDAEKRASGAERLSRVGREAAMQSRRVHLPVVAPVVEFADVAGLAGAALADHGGGPPGLDGPTVLVGPEGGWTPAERAVDLPVVGLGPQVLRAETAAIAAGVLLTAMRSGVVLPGRSGT